MYKKGKKLKNSEEGSMLELYINNPIKKNKKKPVRFRTGFFIEITKISLQR